MIYLIQIPTITLMLSMWKLTTMTFSHIIYETLVNGRRCHLSRISQITSYDGGQKTYVIFSFSANIWPNRILRKFWPCCRGHHWLFLKYLHKLKIGWISSFSFVAWLWLSEKFSRLFDSSHELNQTTQSSTFWLRIHRQIQSGRRQRKITWENELNVELDPVHRKDSWFFFPSLLSLPDWTKKETRKFLPFNFAFIYNQTKSNKIPEIFHLFYSILFIHFESNLLLCYLGGLGRDKGRARKFVVLSKIRDIPHCHGASCVLRRKNSLEQQTKQHQHSWNQKKIKSSQRSFFFKFMNVAQHNWKTEKKTARMNVPSAIQIQYCKIPSFPRGRNFEKNWKNFLKLHRLHALVSHIQFVSYDNNGKSEASELATA